MRSKRPRPPRSWRAGARPRPRDARAAACRAALLPLLAILLTGAAPVARAADCLDRPLDRWLDCIRSGDASVADLLTRIDRSPGRDPHAAVAVLRGLAGHTEDAPLYDAARLDALADRLIAAGETEAAADAARASLERLPVATRVRWVQDDDPAPRRGALLGADAGRTARLARVLALAGDDALALELLRAAASAGQADWRDTDWGGEFVASIPFSERPLRAGRWFLPPVDASLRVLGTEHPIALRDLRGEVVILDFWATWCPPCVEGLPKLAALMERYEGAPVRAFAVNTGETPHVAMAFADEHAVALPVAIYEESLDAAFDVETLPTLVVLDRDGHVRGRWDSYIEGVQERLPRLIDRLLGPDEPIEVGTVVEDRLGFEVVWTRDLPERIAAVTAARRDGERFWLLSVGARLITIDVTGKIVDQWRGMPRLQKLVTLSDPADGSTRLLGFRPGGRELAVVDLAGPSVETARGDAPLFDVAVSGPADAWLATADGLRRQSVGADGKPGRPVAVGDAALVSAVVVAPGDPAGDPARDGLRALRRDGSRVDVVRLVDGDLRSQATLTPPPWSLARVEGALAVLPRDVHDRAVGRPAPDGRERLVVRLDTGQVVVVDPARDEVDARFRIPDLSAVAVADLDGDGRDEVAIAAGRRIFVLAVPR